MAAVDQELLTTEEQLGAELARVTEEMLKQDPDSTHTIEVQQWAHKVGNDKQQIVEKTLEKEARIRLCERWVAAASGALSDFSHRVADRRQGIKRRLEQKHRTVETLEREVVTLKQRRHSHSKALQDLKNEWHRKEVAERNRVASFADFVAVIEERTQRLEDRRQLLEREWGSARQARQSYLNEYTTQRQQLEISLRQRLQFKLEEIARSKQQV